MLSAVCRSPEFPSPLRTLRHSHKRPMGSSAKLIVAKYFLNRLCDTPPAWLVFKARWENVTQQLFFPLRKFWVVVFFSKKLLFPTCGHQQQCSKAPVLCLATRVRYLLTRGQGGGRLLRVAHACQSQKTVPEPTLGQGTEVRFRGRAASWELHMSVCRGAGLRRPPLSRADL